MFLHQMHFMCNQLLFYFKVYTNPLGCKSLVSGLRKYAVDQGFMTEQQSYHICYVDGDQYYYKGQPTCVGAGTNAWTSCDSSQLICAGVDGQISYFGYMKNQMYILGKALEQSDNIVTF